MPRGPAAVIEVGTHAHHATRGHPRIHSDNDNDEET
jgi:hypothetical protein